jgi:hypothetical protein
VPHHYVAALDTVHENVTSGSAATFIVLEWLAPTLMNRSLCTRALVGTSSIGTAN